MKLIPVESIPRMKSNHKLQELIEEFVNGDADIVKVEFGADDYKVRGMQILLGGCYQTLGALYQGLASWR